MSLPIRENHNIIINQLLYIHTLNLINHTLNERRNSEKSDSEPEIQRSI